MLTFMWTCVTCTSYVTSLGWRWMNSKTKSLMEVTGRALKDRVAMWDGKKNRRVLGKNFPVIYRLSSKKHFKIPGNLEPILGHESVVSLRRKRHFLKKTLKTAARFSPRREVYDIVWVCSLGVFFGLAPTCCDGELRTLNSDSVNVRMIRSNHSGWC